MDGLSIRLLLLARFVVFLAVVYLLLDLAASRTFRRPDSKVRAFFALVASPITHAVRALLLPKATDDQVRWAAIGLATVVWAVLALMLRGWSAS